MTTAGATFDARSSLGTQGCGYDFGLCGKVMWLGAQANNYFTDSNAGVKDAAKLLRTGPQWVQVFDSNASPSWHAADKLFKGIKNFAGGTLELPGKIWNLIERVVRLESNPSLETGYEMVAGVRNMVSPIHDTVELLHDNRVINFPGMKALGNLNAAALFWTMTDLLVRDTSLLMGKVEIYMQAPAPGQTNANDRAEWSLRQIGLITVDMLKEISYVALAAFALISAFFLTIPHVGTWILACATSALFFTLLGEFAGRSFKEYAERVDGALVAANQNAAAKKLPVPVAV